MRHVPSTVHNFHVAPYSSRVSAERLERSLAHSDVLHQITDALSCIRHAKSANQSPQEALKSKFGYSLKKAESTIPKAGFGLFLSGRVVCLYPGLIYQPGDPVFWVSFSNGYLLRLSDGSSLDGKYYGLSKRLYLGTLARNSFRMPAADDSWLKVERDDDLSSAPNPFAHGQLINHGGDAANVMYYEVVFPPDFPSSLRLLIPSLHYQSAQPYLRTVCLVATRDVKDEELLADYHFIGRSEVAANAISQ